MTSVLLDTNIFGSTPKGGESKIMLDKLPLALAGGSVEQEPIGFSQRKGKYQSSFQL